MAIILDGKALSKKIESELKRKIARLRQKPKVVIFQVGNISESEIFIKRKKIFGTTIGALVDHKQLSLSISEKILLKEIESANKNKSVHGIIVQFPLPKHISKQKIIEAIDPKKDVDGLTSTNLKLLASNSKLGLMPATTKSIFTLLDSYKIALKGSHIAVIGRSMLVGKPTALQGLNRDATVTICHRHTKNLASYTQNADIVICAVGHAKLIGKKHVKRGQVIVDVGISSITRKDGSRKISGDVDFEKVQGIVKAITPVPGGVGPMTVASLFQNLLEAYRMQM